MSTTILTRAVVLPLAAIGVCGGLLWSQAEGNEDAIPGFPEASLTIFPVSLRLTGPVGKDEHVRAFVDAFKRRFREEAREYSSTLGLLLEERGYAESAVADTNFRFPEEEAAQKERATAFGEFIRKMDLKSDYALGIQLTIHTGKGGWQEAYAVIVDAGGNVAWEDSQGPGDGAFNEELPGTEFGRLELACARLTPVLGIDKLPEKELADDKKQALREMRAKEPPRRSEFAATERRLAALRKAGAAARVLVYPARTGGDQLDATSATRLSSLLNEDKLCNATAATAGPLLKGSGWPNEMHVLWLFARTVREYVRAHPVDSDYVLFADYWQRPTDKGIHAVHFVVCDRAGDWVIVDLQNSHQADFQRVQPKDLADCDRLVVERFRARKRAE